HGGIPAVWAARRGSSQHAGARRPLPDGPGGGPRGDPRARERRQLRATAAVRALGSPLFPAPLVGGMDAYERGALRRQVAARSRRSRTRIDPRLRALASPPAGASRARALRTRRRNADRSLEGLAHAARTQREPLDRALDEVRGTSGGAMNAPV